MWTKVHSFFLIMGGIVAQTKDGPRIIHYRDVVGPMGGDPTLSPEGASTTPTVAQYSRHAQGPSESTIVDKEEVKVSVQHTSATEGRLSSLMTLNPPFAQLKIEKEEIDDKSKGDGLAKAIVLIQTLYFLIQLLARVAQRLTITKLEIMTLAYALLCGMLYLFWWHKPYNVQRPISVRIEDFTPQVPPPTGKGGIARIMNGGFVLNLHRSIIGDGEGLEVLQELADDPELSMNINLHRLATASSFLTATAFGGVHCIAWNFEFTTRAERLVWNVSAALVTTIPLVWITMVILGYFVDRLKRWCGDGRARGYVQALLGVPLFVLVFGLVCAYFICRVILVVEAFVLLSDLSPGARASLNWSSFIPHR